MEYTIFLKEYLGEDRHSYTKKMFKFMYSAYRAVENGRITWERVLELLDKKGV